MLTYNKGKKDSSTNRLIYDAIHSRVNCSLTEFDESFMSFITKICKWDCGDNN